MNRAVLMVAALVLALLAAFYYFVDIRGLEAEQAEETAARRLVSDFDQQLVRAVSIEPADGPVLRVSRSGTEAVWRVETPEEVEADPAVVQQLLEALGRLTVLEDPFLPGEDGLSPYGLAPPRLAVTVTADNGAELARLELGGPAPLGASRYAAVRDTGEVGQVSAAEAEAIPGTLFELREKRLLRFRREEVREVRIGIAEQTAVAIRRQGDNWEIFEPLVFAADRELLGNLLWELAECRALEFPGDAEQVDLSANLSFRIGLTMADGSETVARFGAPAKGGDGVFASGDSGTMMKVDAAIVNSALRPAERWRELRPFPRYSWEVDGLTVARAGGDPASWSKDDHGGWQRAGDVPDAGTAPEEAVLQAIDLLTGLEACGLTLIGGADVLEAAGLAESAFSVTLSGGTGEAFTVESLILGLPDRWSLPLPDSCAAGVPLVCGMRPEGDWLYLINEPGRDELRAVLEKLCAGPPAEEGPSGE